MKLLTRTPLWRRAVRKAGRLLFDKADNNNVWRMSKNGELWLIRSVMAAHAAEAERGLISVIDAGAHAGDYTAAVLGQSDERGCEVAVRAFEPGDRAAASLRSRFANDPRVTIVQAALGRESGTARLFGERGSSLASLIQREVLAGSESVEVKMTRLDDYLSEQSIHRVQLLKLDVEGSEFEALEGLGVKLNPEIVETIQFEYGGTTLDARVTLRDLYDLLSRRGYVVGKLLPHAVDIRPYSPGMEHYAYSNFVAVSPRRLGAGRGRTKTA